MDELDQLIEGALNPDGDSAEPTDVEESPPEPDATGDVADELTEDEVVGEDESDIEDPQEESLPDEGEDEESDPEEPGGTEETPVVESTPSPDVVVLQQKVQQQQEFIRSVIEQAKAEQERVEAERRRQEEEQEYQKLLERLDEMDPDEARREHVAYVAKMAAERDKALRSENEQLREQIAMTQQEKARQEEAEKEAKAKEVVVQHLAKQHKLTEFEVWTMSNYSTPLQMEEYAKRAERERKSQTRAAREARRKEIESNPALKGGDPGPGTPRPTLEPAKDVDELIDRILQ